MRIKFIFLLTVIFVIGNLNNVGYSQETQPRLSLNEGPIENRFNYVIRNASDYEDSKVVKSWWLYRLKSNVLDSLKSLKDSINNAYIVIAGKDLQIDSLENDLLSVHEKLGTAVDEKNTLSLFGINMSKALYNSILWTIIGGLVIALIIFIVLFKRSNHVTRISKSDLAELKDEFEAFRKRALEREQQIARELYDEVRKYKKKLGEL
ncbi:MAG: hypothetical protein JXB00_06260 [Bacteroidales bacterium]|nr:hypothetical protein [Bacteroidales bacterium]